MKHVHEWQHIGVWTDWGDIEYRAFKCECGAVLKQFEDGGEFIQEPPKKEGNNAGQSHTA